MTKQPDFNMYAFNVAGPKYSHDALTPLITLIVLCCNKNKFKNTVQGLNINYLNYPILAPQLQNKE